MIYAIAGLLVAWVGLALFNAYGTKPAVIGATDGRLADCPASPNCVCSQATRDEQRIEPIPFSGSPRDAIVAIQETVKGTAGMRIVSSDERYIHATATSRLMRFVDDVEFLVNEVDGVIHLRSASRLGYSDMGANARRVESLRDAIIGRLP